MERRIKEHLMWEQTRSIKDHYIQEMEAAGCNGPTPLPNLKRLHKSMRENILAMFTTASCGNLDYKIRQAEEFLETVCKKYG